MDNLRRAKINEFANSIRNALNLPVPTDVDAVVTQLGGQIEEFRPEFGQEAEAYVRKDGDSFAIAIRDDVPPNRRRFSIAHELGHLFLHLGYLVDDELWNSTEAGYLDSVRHRLGFNEEEYEAHEFAGAFLMPEKEFREVANRTRKGKFYDVNKIAEHFAVSIAAAQTRGRWLGVFGWD